MTNAIDSGFGNHYNSIENVVDHIIEMTGGEMIMVANALGMLM